MKRDNRPALKNQHEQDSLSLRGGEAFVPWSDDPALPAQFYPAKPASPERRLMAAVLEDAIHLITSPRMRESRMAEDARVWIAATDSDAPLSFVHLCEFLGLEPEPIRRRVLPRRFRVFEGGRR